MVQPWTLRMCWGCRSVERRWSPALSSIWWVLVWSNTTSWPLQNMTTSNSSQETQRRYRHILMTFHYLVTFRLTRSWSCLNPKTTRVTGSSWPIWRRTMTGWPGPLRMLRSAQTWCRSLTPPGSVSGAAQSRRQWGISVVTNSKIWLNTEYWIYSEIECA